MTMQPSLMFDMMSNFDRECVLSSLGPTETQKLLSQARVQALLAGRYLKDVSTEQEGGVEKFINCVDEQY